jgi:hypothetical protein
MNVLKGWFGNREAESLGVGEIEKRLGEAAAPAKRAPSTFNQYRSLMMLVYREARTLLRAALDGLIKGTQVQTPNQCPNSSRRLVFADEVFDIHGSPTHLLSVHVANQRLFADRIFLAHAASLRQTFYFARWKLGGFLHSFVSPHPARAPKNAPLKNEDAA